MEGVMMVEMTSGSLHYTKSFSNAFEARHPTTERLNLGALLFALQNFAGSSIRSINTKSGNAAAKGQQTNAVDEIVLFATSLENMALAATPSKRFLVVLFTTPTFDTDVAKRVVRRMAFNYEQYESTTMGIVGSHSQVPRRFRYALSRAVDEAVEQELMRLGESIFVLEQSKAGVESSDLFVFFYYSARLASNSDYDVEGESSATQSADVKSKEERRRAARPMQVEKPRSYAATFSLSNMVIAVRAFFSACFQPDSKQCKKGNKRPRWRSRNAIRHHAELHEFKRVVPIFCDEDKSALLQSNLDWKAYRIADTVFPFVEVLRASLTPTLPDRQMRPQLCQLVWKNVLGTDVIAWRSGSCCIFYPFSTKRMNPEYETRDRLAVTAMFDILEPLLKAKMMVLV